MPIILSGKHWTTKLLLVCILAPTFYMGMAQTFMKKDGDGVRLVDGSKVIIDDHEAKYDRHGHLLPWTSMADAIDREMQWYRSAPWDNGYPRFATVTFMDDTYQPTKRTDIIPAMQNGMGIISYLKYYRWKKGSVPDALKVATAMGNFLVKETLTPNTGKYPNFTRSTGIRGQFPLQPDAGSQRDNPYEIEPDKGGIAGYALVLLYDQTHDKRYLQQALQNARDLVHNMTPGDAAHSPWPFRVDYRTGEARGPVSSNMSFNLRLFDTLIAHGYNEFEKPRAELWAWIKTYQIPSAKTDGSLWVQFFEDHAQPDNRNAWAPLNLARYLVEKRDSLDPDWKADSRTLIHFAVQNFCSLYYGMVVCGEQDYDKKPWGGVYSTFGGVLAKYSAATGDPTYKGLAWQILTFELYTINKNGAPRTLMTHEFAGGWQEDAHTDKIHNYIDAMEAFPEWAHDTAPVE